ncbi:MAG: adenosine kinase [Bacteroidales bacterium]|jgi:sugar/nucleoside kinase (ribokinase family)|nr:adenosine kinase [Bacteroidales bacterium]
MTTTKILGLGNALVDIVIQLENDSQLNELELPKGSMQLVDLERAQRILNYFKNSPHTLTSGGSAANTLNGVANLGGNASFVGCVGNDKYGEFFKTDMLESGIKPHLFTGTVGTGTAITLMSPDSERTFATYLGSAIELSANHLSAEVFEGYDYFHIEGYLVQNYDLIRTAIRLAKQAGCRVSLDLASYNVVEENLPFLTEMVENYVDILFANEEEAHAFCKKSAEETLTYFAKFAEYAIVKIGKKGSLVQHKNQVEHIGIPTGEIRVIDTNGAGDAYAAGFLHGIMTNMDLKSCGNLGAKLAGEVVQVVGPKLSKNQWKKILNNA